MKTIKHFDIIIIGSGVAGMTCALNSLRAGKKVLILEKESYGGQISFSPRVENIPSIKEISGEEFAENLFDQISSLGVFFELENALSISKENNLFKVTTDYNTYTALSVIIATGVKNKKINLPNEEELIGKGVSYCAICDGAFYKDKDVAMIGDGNTALRYAILLSDYCKKVYICTLFDKFFGDYVVEQSLKSKKNIEVIHNVSLKEFLFDKVLNGLRFKTQDDKDLILNVNAVFIAIGQVPDNQKWKDLVDLTPDGYIITDETCETKTKGLFAIGDCRYKSVRQIVTAASDGSISSFFASMYINSLNNL